LALMESQDLAKQYINDGKEGEREKREMVWWSW
jgi:hypothetical protein